MFEPNAWLEKMGGGNNCTGLAFIHQATLNNHSCVGCRAAGARLALLEAREERRGAGAQEARVDALQRRTDAFLGQVAQLTELLRDSETRQLQAEQLARRLQHDQNFADRSHKADLRVRLKHLRLFFCIFVCFLCVF